MSKNPNLARHRATPARNNGLKTISKAVSSNAGTIGRPAAVVAAASGLMLGMSAPASAAQQHTVESGDTLSEIAAQHDVSLGSVLQLNGLGANSVIYPGDTVKVSGSAESNSASASTYTVKSGDTLGKIAAAHDVSLQTVFGLNDMGWNTVIYPGDVIKLSGGANYSAAGSVEASETAAPAPAPAPEPAPAPAPAPEPAPAPAPASAPDNTGGVTTASSGAQALGASVSTAGIAGTAQSMVGSPYVYGGTSPSAGWDCSGFVQWVYAQNGIDLPRTYQWHAMTPTSNPQPGDLVVQNGGSHVGIYIGGGKMVSALNPSQGTLVHDVSAMSVMGFFTM